MLATRPQAAPRAARLRRGVNRGSLLGLGLLVAGGAAAPAALAEDPTDLETADAIPETPVSTVPVLVATPVPSAGVSGPLSASFGTGKAFDLALTVDGTAPGDLDLAGATFAFTQNGTGAPAATCTTTSSGTCTVNYDNSGTASRAGSAVGLGNGTYTVAQVDAVDGLAPVSGVVGTFTMDDDAFTWPFGCCVPEPARQAIAVTNVSGYSPKVIASVVDADTGEALPGAAFSLSASADYPATTAPATEADLADPAVPSSDEDGVLAFDGWFLPGDLTLTPIGVPDGYQLGAAMTLTVPSTAGFHAPAAWALAEPLEIVRVAAPEVEEPPVVVTDPQTTPTPIPSPPSAPVPTPRPTATSPAPSPSAVAPAASRAPSAEVRQEEAVPTPAATTTSPPSAAAGTSWPRDNRDPGADVPPLADGSDLQTVSSSVPAWSVLAAGLLFVAVVAGGATLVRRRVRG